MARVHGARAQVALAFETTYGTPPASGYTRMPFASTTLAPGLKPVRLTFQDHHVVDELHRHPEPCRRRSMRMPFLDKGNHTLSKVHSMWLAYLGPSYLHRRQGSKGQTSRESCDRESRKPL